jgi:hypothetical protein
MQELAKLIKNWSKNNDEIRFGQNLWNIGNAFGMWESPEANSLFFISDKDLAKMITQWATKNDAVGNEFIKMMEDNGAEFIDD